MKSNLVVALLCAGLVQSVQAQIPAGQATINPVPYVRVPASRDGIGKQYMGREIARVMGHQAADWLERPERLTEERPDLLIGELDIKPGMMVADIGAGTGYHVERIAPLVTPGGKVFAVDIQPEMLTLLEQRLKRQGIFNAVPVLGLVDDPKLAAQSLDLIIMVDVYHEFEFPAQMLNKMVAALKPGGRIAFVEFRAEDASVPIKTLHKMSEAQVRKEAALAGLTWLRTGKSLPWQHVVIFKK